jgi:hypothetical protein
MQTGEAMSHAFRALAVVVLGVPLATGCVQAGWYASGYQSGAEAPPPTAVATPAVVPLPGHPPIAVSGVLATFDPATDMLRLEDGRLVKLTGQSKFVAPVREAVRPGDLVALQEVLPVAVQSGFTTLAVGKPQRLGTIAAVDEASGVLQLTDGTVVNVNRSTNVHMGAAGSNVALGQLSPGDEVAVVLGAAAPPTPAEGTGAEPSALPRQDLSLPAVEAAEVMVFRAPRRN